MKRHTTFPTVLSLIALIGMLLASASPAQQVTHAQLLAADQRPGDWMTYHRNFKGWHYSALDQINTKNVSRLAVAWSHACAERQARMGNQADQH